MVTTKPSADKAESNRAILKSLAREDANKVCADCKTNKHPRWASWNLGIFVCIRCSGIHRSLGVHISKVKSVDLDSWTDEQVASMQQWGNARANEYWEARMKKGHVPSDEKIVSFIQTKYDHKRWAMECTPLEAISALAGDELPVQEVSTTNSRTTAVPDRFSSYDDNVPLSVARNRALSNPKRHLSPKQPSRALPQTNDLLGAFDADFTGDVEPSSTTAPPPPPKKAGGSFISFFGSGSNSSSQGSTPVIPPASNTNTNNNREDLKKSILSLYATQPTKASPSIPPATAPATSSGGSGIIDAFSSLSLFSSKPKASSAAASTTSRNGSTTRSPDLGQIPRPSSGFGGGNTNSSSGFGSAGSGDLLGLSFGGGSSHTTAPMSSSRLASPPVNSSTTSALPSLTSAFTLSSSKPNQSTKPMNASTMPIMDAHNPWANNGPDTAAVPATATTATIKSPPVVSNTFSSSANQGFKSNTGGFDSGSNLFSDAAAWSSNTGSNPLVAPDEEFSDWASAVPEPRTTTSHTTTTTSKVTPAFSGSDNLFDNVWS